MKRTLAWLAGIVGLATAGRLLSRRRTAPAPAEGTAPPAPVEHEPGVDPLTDPAEELRRKLAANRQSDTPPEPAAEVVETLDERRARVHAKAREAIDAMSNEEGDQ